MKRIALAWLLLTWVTLLQGDAPADSSQERRAALSRWQPFVGEWRGVGQPRRGSAKDAWTEECQWAWSFAGKDVSLALDSANAKYFRTAKLRPTGEGRFQLEATTAQGNSLQYTGAISDDGHLVLDADKVYEELPARITIRLVADGDRMLVLYERQAAADRYARLAEVGFTRKGSNFGKGTSYVECVVTGGLGTIAVTHEGQTYYVCCTGCRDYFQDQPAEVLAEYKARKEAEKKEKK